MGTSKSLLERPAVSGLINEYRRRLTSLDTHTGAASRLGRV